MEESEHRIGRHALRLLLAAAVLAGCWVLAALLLGGSAASATELEIGTEVTGELPEMIPDVSIPSVPDPAEDLPASVAPPLPPIDTEAVVEAAPRPLPVVAAVVDQGARAIETVLEAPVPVMEPAVDVLIATASTESTPPPSPDAALLSASVPAGSPVAEGQPEVDDTTRPELPVAQPQPAHAAAQAAPDLPSFPSMPVGSTTPAEAVNSAPTSGHPAVLEADCGTSLTCVLAPAESGGDLPASPPEDRSSTPD